MLGLRKAGGDGRARLLREFRQGERGPCRSMGKNRIPPSGQPWQPRNPYGEYPVSVLISRYEYTVGRTENRAG